MAKLPKPTHARYVTDPQEIVQPTLSAPRTKLHKKKKLKIITCLPTTDVRESSRLLIQSTNKTTAPSETMEGGAAAAGGGGGGGGGGAPALPAPAKAYVRGQSDIFEYLHSVAAQRILILDGAMGTMIQTHKLGEAEYVVVVVARYVCPSAPTHRPLSIVCRLNCLRGSLGCFFVSNTVLLHTAAPPHRHCFVVWMSQRVGCLTDCAGTVEIASETSTPRRD